jgi:hypothetical protein
MAARERNQVAEGLLVPAKKPASGAEARTIFNDLAARVKLVPFPTFARIKFFRSVIRSCSSMGVSATISPGYVAD